MAAQRLNRAAAGWADRLPRASTLCACLVLASCAPRIPGPPLGSHRGDTPHEVTYRPPVAQVEEIPPAPNEEAVWVDGSYQYRGGEYVWQSGVWTLPRGGAVYAPPTLVRRRDGSMVYSTASGRSPCRSLQARRQSHEANNTQPSRHPARQAHILDLGPRCALMLLGGGALTLAGCKDEPPAPAPDATTRCRFELRDGRGSYVSEGPLPAGQTRMQLDKALRESACGKMCDAERARSDATGGPAASGQAGCIARCAVDLDAGKLGGALTCERG